MWPWEHLAVGYVAYSLGKRALGARPPGRPEVLVLAIGTQFPDLIDKPLGWGTTLLPSGVSLAHSYLFAIPLVALAILLTWGMGRSELGYAFGTGYLLHTPADVFATYLLDGYLFLGAFIWPLASVPPMAPQPVLGRTSELFIAYLEILGTPKGFAYFLIEVGLLATALFVWLLDRRTRRTRAVPAGVAD